MPRVLCGCAMGGSAMRSALARLARHRLRVREGAARIDPADALLHAQAPVDLGLLRPRAHAVGVDGQRPTARSQCLCCIGLHPLAPLGAKSEYLIKTAALTQVSLLVAATDLDRASIRRGG